MNTLSIAPAPAVSGLADQQLHVRFVLQFAQFRLDVDVQLPGRGVTALFGYSGSGKTTLLRCIAGLERAQDSHLRINGDV